MCRTTAWRRRPVAAAADNIHAYLDQMLAESGQTANVTLSQSRHTGTVYMKVRLYRDNGDKIKGAGFTVRISNHWLPGTRHTNFSRPAHHYFGIADTMPHCRVVTKFQHILAQMIKRARQESERRESEVGK